MHSRRHLLAVFAAVWAVAVGGVVVADAFAHGRSSGTSQLGGAGGPGGFGRGSGAFGPTGGPGGGPPAAGAFPGLRGS